jgi:hypothetical protein
MEKLLKQLVLQGAMLDVVVNLKQYETTVEIVDSMRRGWQVSRLIIVKAKNVVSSMVISSFTQSLVVVG